MTKPKGLETRRYFAKTYQGLEAVLAAELGEMGIIGAVAGFRGVSFACDRRTMYRVNYCSRLSLRILEELASFEAGSEQELYDQVRERVDWGDVLSTEHTFAVDAVVHSPLFKHSKYLALKTKDAIADQFRERTGKRPSVDTEEPDYRIHLHVQDRTATVYLDTSGSSLHLRGYKKHGGLAPLSEVLAAGLVALSGWTPDRPLIDPMCGSGTIIIEAAFKALRWPAQYFRKGFGFMHWKDFDSMLWEEVRNEAHDLRLNSLPAPILGYDHDAITLRKCMENLISSRLYGEVDVQVASFERLEPAVAGDALLITNPPYDERMPLANAYDFYGMLGSRLKHLWQGKEAWILAADTPALHAVGLRPSQKFRLFNGPIPCRFVQYEMFAGSRKDYRRSEDNRER